MDLKNSYIQSLQYLTLFFFINTSHFLNGMQVEDLQRSSDAPVTQAQMQAYQEQLEALYGLCLGAIQEIAGRANNITSCFEGVEKGMAFLAARVGRGPSNAKEPSLRVEPAAPQQIVFREEEYRRDVAELTWFLETWRRLAEAAAQGGCTQEIKDGLIVAGEHLITKLIDLRKRGEDFLQIFEAEKSLKEVERKKIEEKMEEIDRELSIKREALQCVEAEKSGKEAERKKIEENILELDCELQTKRAKRSSIIQTLINCSRELFSKVDEYYYELPQDVELARAYIQTLKQLLEPDFDEEIQAKLRTFIALLYYDLQEYESAWKYALEAERMVIVDVDKPLVWNLMGALYSVSKLSDSKALIYILKAANQTVNVRVQANAWAWLGEMYKSGRGVAWDETKALEYYKKAAEQRTNRRVKILAENYLKSVGKADISSCVIL